MALRATREAFITRSVTNVYGVTRDAGPPMTLSDAFGVSLSPRGE
jgi:hypothetical protein